MKINFTKNSSYKVIRITDNENITLTFDTYYSFEKRNFDIINIPNDDNLINIILNNNEVDAIVVQFENKKPELHNIDLLPDYYKRIVYYYDANNNYGIDLALKINKSILSYSNTPKFSFITSLYNTNLEYFKKCYDSLCNQRVNDWEWILLDDSPEELTNVRNYIYKQYDVRLKYFRIEPTNGNIGLTKWRASCMSKGRWLIELDHDDMLNYWCLEVINEAIEAYPENKFIYSDNTTIDQYDNVTECAFGPDYTWGLGYGYSYQSKTPDNTTIRTDSSGPINNATIRHIVGVPNHFRCWERNLYFSIGGHNQHMRIADDYELLIRTFFKTRFTHIHICCYAQRFDGNNSQYKNEIPDSDGQGNISDIQRRVRLASIFYDEDIHNRLEELGLDDSKWIKGDPYETAHVYEKLHLLEMCEDVYIPDWAK